jgi:hypothetical protein
MEKSAFTRLCLSCVRVIMAIMHVPVVELQCQTTMGWLPVLKYLLSGVRGCLLLCLVVPGIKCNRFPKTRFHWWLSDAESPRAWLPGARVHPDPFQPGVVMPYPVWGDWFPSRVLLEGTGHIQIFGL